MFALHEKTQRLVCRGIFLVACVLPVVLTIVLTAYCNRPWRESDWQRTLTQGLHLRAALDEISTPRPGETSLTNLRLADLRTELPLGSIDKLRCQRRGARLNLHADRLEIQAGQLPQLATALATWLATGERETLNFHADQVAFVGPAQQIVQLQNLSISSDISGPQQQSFRFKAFDSVGETIQLELQHTNGTIHSLLSNQQAGLPAWLIGKFVPGMSGCGQATFQGILSTTNDNQHSGGKLSGSFQQVDLQAWVGSTGPHRMQGVAQVALQQFTWSDRRIETARGKITSENGVVSQSLVAALCKGFACVPATGWETLRGQESLKSEELMPFKQLALSFQMSNVGIAFAGECTGGELLVGKGGPVLYGPREKGANPIANFVHLFHLPRRGWMPDTRESLNMASELPLPGDERDDDAVLQK